LEKYFGLNELKYYDLPYYSRKYKEENYQIDDEKIREYFEFNHVLSWMFDFVEKFFGISVKSINNHDSDEMRYEVYYK
jgi:Zn-dependent oligopeptidase